MAVWLSLVISKGFVRWTWDKHREDATDAGVLDGHVDTSPLDLKESADFLDALRCQKHGDFMIWFFDWSTTTFWPKHFLCVVWGFLGDVFCVDSFDFSWVRPGKLDKCSFVTCGCLWFACYIDLLWFVLIYKRWRPSSVEWGGVWFGSLSSGWWD